MAPFLHGDERHPFGFDVVIVVVDLVVVVVGFGVIVVFVVSSFKLIKKIKEVN